MSNTSSQALSVRERPATSDRRLYLAAGFGGVLAAASWAIQPLLVMQAGDDLPTLDYLLTHPWHGAIEAAVFTGMGVGVLFLVLAIGALTERRLSVVSTWARTGHVLGVLAGCSWILLAGWSIGGSVTRRSDKRLCHPKGSASHAQRRSDRDHPCRKSGLGCLVGLPCHRGSEGRSRRRTPGHSGRRRSHPRSTAVHNAVLRTLGAVLGMPAFTLLAGIAFLLKARRTL
jgi:hypothetical protein